MELGGFTAAIARTLEVEADSVPLASSVRASLCKNAAFVICIAHGEGRPMTNERHPAEGGRVCIYRRPNSRFWQCQGTFEGKSERASTKTENLDDARRFAENWYMSRCPDLSARQAGSSAQMRVEQARRANYNLPLHDKRSRFLAAPVGLVAEVGFRDAQVNSIAAHAGLAPATLYR